MSPRRHLWLPDDSSMCRLARNTGEIETAALDPAEVPSCGPCLVAVSVVGGMAAALLDESPKPVQTVAESTDELLAGAFRAMGSEEDLRGFMNRVGDDSFARWFAFVLWGPADDSEPTPPATPPATGTVARASAVREDDDVDASVA